MIDIHRLCVSHRRRVAAFLLAAASCALSLTGCGGGSSSAGVSVTGKVLLGDKPVEAGLITFVTDDGRSASAQLGPGGEFTLPNAPTGKVYIGVNTQMLRGQQQLHLQQSKGKEVLQFVDVPPRYADPKSSGLTEVIEAGKTIEIRLRP
ncbi:MAG: hypothetical protein N3E46_00880 [Gemmataceae bacterium]|uniref:Carboxypeptidase regulatory-like domain-containing protein n=1 Tax=Thermogemmata fonticola TaxID=2755323 RepID=A0A7V9AB80_9BACT|nr:hypothetical protein [Thermogemmata fonticola]MBA2225654.1 hypothetical protein [Thermogemmata fonticola]MCX8138222.1 hypothetical protein [Gemmataceae bacterium]